MRRGFTIVEVAVAAGVFSLVLYIVMAGTNHFKSTYLTDQLSQATQNALVLASWFEEDLRQAVRDPRTSRAIEVDSGTAPAVKFYRATFQPGQFAFTVVPVRWALEEDAATHTAILVRTAWDPQANSFETKRFGFAHLPMPGHPGTPPDANPFGLRVEGDAVGPLQTVILTVLARKVHVTGAGAGQDRVTVQVTAAVPPTQPHSAALFQPLRSLASLP